MPVCNNCHQSFEGKYCSHCGQKGSVGRLSIQEIFHEVVHSFTHAEKGILRLSKELIFSPGKVYASYFNGKRKIYFSPVTFFLLMMGLLLFFGERIIIWDRHITGNQNDVEAIIFRLQKIRYLIFIPLMSIITYFFYYKRYNLAECLAFWFFCMGMIIVVELISYIPQFIFVNQRHTIRYFTDWLLILLILLHIFTVFFERKWWSGIKCFVLALLPYFMLAYIIKLLAYTKGFNADFNLWHLLQGIFK